MKKLLGGGRKTESVNLAIGPIVGLEIFV